MNKFMLILACVFVLLGTTGCSTYTQENIVRIHIRANSNEGSDQEVKLEVRDNIISYITPLISTCTSSDEVKNVLNSNLNSIENIADDVLEKNGFLYKSNARLKKEYFPSRDYEGITFPADYYDALIINLGSGEGDNWWCVAYPQLCFVGQDNGSEKIEYRSKILELIEEYFGG